MPRTQETPPEGLDNSRPLPVFDSPETEKGHFRRLARKPLSELSQSEIKEYFDLKAKYDRRAEKDRILRTKGLLEKQRAQEKTRMDWVSSGNREERFFKFLQELINTNILQGGIFGITPNTWKSSDYPKIQSLIKEYKLEKFFK
jgi:hypothetical protein